MLFDKLACGWICSTAERSEPRYAVERRLIARQALVEVAGVEPASEDTASEASTSLVSCFGLGDASSHDRDEVHQAF